MPLRKLLIVRTVIFVAILIAAKSLVAQTAYVASYDQTFGTVDLATGSYTQLGTSGVILGGLAVGADGSLYGCGWPNSSTLYKVDPQTGDLTTVGNSPITYYIFGSTTSGVFAMDVNGNLYSVNVTNAATTLIGPTGLNAAMIAFGGASTGASTLYFAMSIGSAPMGLYSINTNTGAPTLVGSTGEFSLGALVFENGTLYAGSGITSPYPIYTMNPSTGAASFVANTPAGDFVGLAPTVTAPSPLSAYVYFGDNESGTANNGFGTVNLATGSYTPLGNTGLLLQTIAESPTGSLYGTANNTLYQINPETGSLTTVGTSSSYAGIGSTTSAVYALDSSSNLYSVNTTNGATTLIGPTGLDLFNGNTVWGPSTGSNSLYVTISNPVDSPSILYSINTNTGAATEIGSTGVSNLGAMVFENGTLYAGSGLSSPYSIFALNLTTGLATFVAPTSGPFWGLAPIAAAPSLQIPSNYSFTVIQNTQTTELIQLTNQSGIAQSATISILNPNSVPAVTLSSSSSVTLNPGQTQNVSLLIDSTSTLPGAYNGVLAQVAISNGPTIYADISITVVAQNLPDLEVGVNDIQPPVVNPDSSVTLSANIHNLGTLSASSVTVQFLDYGTSLGETVIDQLSPNGIALSSLTVPQLSDGNHLIQVLIDPANLIQESNKSNNEASQIVQIGSTPPAFSGDILVTGTMPTTVYTGSLFTISGQATYYLDVNGTIYSNYVVMGGSVLITITSATGSQWVYGNIYTDINGNFSQAIAAPVTAGTYTIAITATDGTFIGTRTLTFTVVAPPLATQPPPTSAPPGWSGSGSGGGGAATATIRARRAGVGIGVRVVRRISRCRRAMFGSIRVTSHFRMTIPHSTSKSL